MPKIALRYFESNAKGAKQEVLLSRPERKSMNGVVENMSSQTSIRTKGRRIAGVVVLSFSVLLYGINLCYARLSQLADIVTSVGYMNQLIYYYDPVLLGFCILAFLSGVFMIVWPTKQSCDHESIGLYPDKQTMK